jgi:hypothetical protein
MGWHPFAKQASRERQLDAELRFHLEQRIADNLVSGMSAAICTGRRLLKASTAIFATHSVVLPKTRALLCSRFWLWRSGSVRQL